MPLPRTSRTILAASTVLAACTLLAGCAGSDTAEPSPVVTSEALTDTSGTPGPDASSDGRSESVAGGTPGPATRRTTEQDVALSGPGVPEVGPDYARAAVPVDAWPVAQVLLDADDAAVRSVMAGLAADGSVVVAGHVEACALISAWALPHPERVVLGYEEHPTVECVRPVDHSVLAVVPDEGINSEGTWRYDSSPEVQTQLRVGT